MSKLVIHRSALDAYGRHVSKWKGCVACELHTTARQKVFCRGVLPAHVLFLGDAPRAEDEDTGYPFRGDKGLDLDEIICDSIGAFNIQSAMLRSAVIKRTAARQSVGLAGVPPTIRFCITNAVLCRSDTSPEKPHLVACSGRLAELIAICQPRLIVLVGKTADKAYIGVMKHLPELIRTVSISDPGWMRRQEDLSLEKARAAASILSGLRNLWSSKGMTADVQAASSLLSTVREEDVPLTEDDIPF